MQHLEFRLLGKPEIYIDGVPFARLKADKGNALLYYLAVTRQQHSRDRLSSLLWGGHNDSDARNNLRNLISVQLKRADPLQPFLEIARDTLQLNTDASISVDVSQFETALRNPQLTLEELESSFNLLRGEFLEDFVVADAPEFEEWMEQQRGSLRQQAIRAGTLLAEQYIQVERYDDAFLCVERVQRFDPLDEQAIYQKMQAHALAGKPGEAISCYERFAEGYEEEFGDDPPEELRKLYAKIKRGDVVGKLAQSAPLPSAQTTWIAPALPPPFQAPAQVHHFVGRERELALIEAALTSEEGNRTVALVGMGGVGKSSLAIEVAHRLLPHFPDGVLWTQTSLGEIADILNGWAKSFGYDFSAVSDVHNRAAALRGLLATRRVLIVLDDVSSLGRIRLLLPGESRCAVLFTTRNQEIAAGLTNQLIPIGELSLDDGIALLASIIGDERCRLEEKAAEEICRLLSNLPLAIEIAGQLLSVRQRMSLAQMVIRLQDASQRVGLSIADHEVRTSFMVSWNALDEWQRRVFQALAVFEGRSFTADALAGILHMDRYAVEDRLSELKVRSLVNEHGLDRYQQHSLLADFALDQLYESESLFRNMAQWYAAFVRQLPPAQEIPAPDWENVMAGMRAAYLLKDWALVLDYAETLAQPWLRQGRFIQARQGCAWAVEAAQHIGDEAAQTRHLLIWGKASVEQDEFAEALQVLNDAYSLALHLEEDTYVVETRHWLAQIAFERSDYPLARRLLEENQQLCQTLDHPIGLAQTYYLLAHCHYDQGNFDLAERLCHQSLELLRQLGTLQLQSNILRLLSDIAIENEQFDTALLCARLALASSEEARDRSEMGASYYSLAVAQRFLQQFAESEEFLRKALDIFEQMGDRGFRAVILYEMSKVMTRLEKSEAALEAALNALALFREVEDRYNLSRTLCHVGDLHLAINKALLAEQYWLEALQIALASNLPLADEIRQRLAERV